jgi:hypothetical protein
VGCGVDGAVLNVFESISPRSFQVYGVTMSPGAVTTVGSPSLISAARASGGRTAWAHTGNA